MTETRASVWGSSSGFSTNLPFEEGEPQPFLHEPNQLPGFAIGHAHLMGSLVQGIRFLDPFQKCIGAFPKSLSIMIEPDLTDDLHGIRPSLYYIENNATLTNPLSPVNLFRKYRDIRHNDCGEALTLSAI